MRKTKVVIITEGDDAGKTFLITRMSAWDQELWAMRAILAMGKAGITVPDGAADAGLAGLMAIGFSSLIRLEYDDAQQLLAELNACIAFVPDVTKVDHAGKPLTRPVDFGSPASDGDVSDVKTLFTLRQEVAELHLGFSLGAEISKLKERLQPSKPVRSRTSRKSAE